MSGKTVIIVGAAAALGIWFLSRKAAAAPSGAIFSIGDHISWAGQFWTVMDLGTDTAGLFYYFLANDLTPGSWDPYPVTDVDLSAVLA